MVTRFPRLAASALIAVAIAGTLAGCNRNYEVLGPYTLGFDGEHLLVGVCEERHVEEVSMDEAHRNGWSMDIHTIWEAEGSQELASGEWLVVSGENPGLTNLLEDRADPSPGVRYDFGIHPVTSPDFSASFTIPESGLPEGMWLTPDGDLTPTPCRENDAPDAP